MGSKGSIKENWRGVKEINWLVNEEGFIEDALRELKPTIKRFTKTLLEVALDEDVRRYTGADYYQRGEERINQRNGYYERYLDTPYGPIECRVPRLRVGGYPNRVFGKYQRRHKDVDGAIKNVFLAGVSTRRVRDALEPLLATGYSAQTVSNVAKKIQPLVEDYHRRDMEDKYVYLIADGIYLSMRGGKRKKQLVLVAYGITEEGVREVIDYIPADEESEANWYRFLNDMYLRGFEGRKLKLVVSDGKAGLIAALDTVYPRPGRQRCWVHKMRNVSGYLRKKDQKECLAGLTEVYNAGSKVEAREWFDDWKENWESICPKAVKCVDNDLENLLRFFDAPKSTWRKVRTTNAIERSFREIRRRARPMSSFNDLRSLDRIVFSVVNHLNDTWRKHPLPNFTHNA